MSSGRTTSPLSMSSSGRHDPLTCPIVPGRETIIEINKGKYGLGVSIVGGSDSLLVSENVERIFFYLALVFGCAVQVARFFPSAQSYEFLAFCLRNFLLFFFRAVFEYIPV